MGDSATFTAPGDAPVPREGQGQRLESEERSAAVATIKNGLIVRIEGFWDRDAALHSGRGQQGRCARIAAMTDLERVRVSIEGGVADVRLTRADKHNGLDWRMFVALNDAVDEVAAAGEDVRVVVLGGEGPSFCAGLDFKSFMSGEGDLTGDGFVRRDGEDANFAQRVTYGWKALPVPVIGALRGACMGGGFQLALAADIRIAEPTTRMSIMEIRYGLVPDMGLSQVISPLVRPDVARELAYTGRVVEAQEALDLGLVTHLADDADAAARELAAQIAEKSPDAIRGIKRLAAEAWGKPPAEALRLEEELQRGLLGTPNQIEAVQKAMSGG
jgi:enoyl-CoA hydratase/carnithine racemase